MKYIKKINLNEDNFPKIDYESLYNQGKLKELKWEHAPDYAKNADFDDSEAIAYYLAEDPKLDGEAVVAVVSKTFPSYVEDPSKGLYLLQVEDPFNNALAIQFKTSKEALKAMEDNILGEKPIFKTLDELENMNETTIKPKAPGRDITQDKQSISGKVEPLIQKKNNMGFNELKNEFLTILKDKTTHASDATRSKWESIINKAKGKLDLMRAISNLYLAGANLKVESLSNRNFRIKLFEEFCNETDRSSWKEGKIYSTGLLDLDGSYEDDTVLYSNADELESKLKSICDKIDGAQFHQGESSKHPLPQVSFQGKFDDFEKFCKELEKNDFGWIANLLKDS